MNYSEDIQTLLQYGIIIDDDILVENTLWHLWLFRLLPYIKLYSNQQYEVNFSEIVDLYNFDRDLRNILWELVEHIEIDIKTKLIAETKDINRKEASLDGKYMNAPQEMENLLEDIIESHKEKIKSDINSSPTRLTTDFQKIVHIASFWEVGRILSQFNIIKLQEIIKYYAIPMKKSVQAFLSRINALRKVRNIWGHHDIGLKNNDYLRISTPSMNGSREVFYYFEILLLFNKSIDTLKMIQLREELIHLLQEWEKKYLIDLEQLMWFPQNWEDILLKI